VEVDACLISIRMPTESLNMSVLKAINLRLHQLE
jgi:hypothetical protein